MWMSNEDSLSGEEEENMKNDCEEKEEERNEILQEKKGWECC